VAHSIADDLINSLSAHIAVLDADGLIVAVNDAWARFARENGGDDAAYVGTNYLEICEVAVGQGDEVAEAIALGFRDLLRNVRTHFAVEYPCHSPTEQRWFDARVTRFTHEGATYLAVVHENITSRKLAEEGVRKAETTLRNVLMALPIGVWIMDEQGQIVHGNPAGQRIWGGARYVGPEQFGEYKGWWLDSGRPIAADEWAAARAIQKGETSIDEEVRIECFDGSSKIILNSAIPLRNPAGGIEGAIIVNQDITARKQVEEKLLEANAAVDATNRKLQQVLARERIKARTDELTGLCNRRAFFDYSKRLFAVAQRYGTPLSVVMFDIDHFKRINDVFGHHVGDAVLKRVARVAREHTREADVLARYGGEEFILTLPNTGATDALGVAEHIRESIARSQETLEDPEASVTISSGVAEMLRGGDTLEQLIQRADQALYAAKRAGRNRSKIYSRTR